MVLSMGSVRGKVIYSSDLDTFYIVALKVLLGRRLKHLDQSIDMELIAKHRALNSLTMSVKMKVNGP